MWFWDGSDKGTASNFVQISEKSAKGTLAVIRQAFVEESMSCTLEVQTPRDRRGRGKWRAKPRACSSLSLTSSGLFIKNLSCRQSSQSAYYCDILRRPRENVQRRRLKLWRQKNWLLHHDSAPSHTSFSSSELFTKNNMTFVPRPPYFSVLNPLTENDFQNVFKNSRSAGNSAYSRKGATLRVMEASRPRVSFWTDDSTSPGNYEWLFVWPRFMSLKNNKL
jgi:hypothetical protein